MPSALARKYDEMRKPSLKERMEQSQRDRAKERRLKIVTEPPVLRHLTHDASTVTIGSHWMPDVILDQGTGTANLQTTIIHNLAGFIGTPLTQVTLNAMNIQTANTWQTWTSANTTTCESMWYTHDRNVLTWRTWADDSKRRVVVQAYEDRWSHRVAIIESEADKKRRLDQESRWQREQEEADKRYLEEEKKKKEADERAMKLLLSCLNRQQQDSLTEKGFFYVTATSGRKYRIDKGTHGNVKVVDANYKVIERLCIQPNGVPYADAMLAQKLMIEHAEDAFRRHANITLNDGKIIHGDVALLDADKLAKVIPIRKAA